MNLKNQDSTLDKLFNNFVNLCLVNTQNESVMLLKAPESVKRAFQNHASYYNMCNLAIGKHVDPDFEKSVKENIKLDHVIQHLKDTNVYRFSFKILNQNQYCEIIYIKLDYLDYLMMGFQILDQNQPSDKEKLQSRKEELRQERSFLDVLSRKYASVYYVDLYKNTVEILKMDDRTNNVLHFKDDSREKLCYEDILEDYCRRFVLKEDQVEFMQRLNAKQVQDILKDSKRFVWQFVSIPNSLGQSHIQLQIMRVHEDSFDGKAIFAFQFIDDILSKEQKYQLELETALKQEMENNEILASLSKIYTSIYVVDLQNKTYKSVYKKDGMVEFAFDVMDTFICRSVQEEYQEIMRDFFDCNTLANRLKNEDTIAIEYLSKDGTWRTSRYIVKKRDEQGCATELLYVTNSISEQKRKEQKLILMAEDANRANQSKTDFLRQISHDIRTPIHGIYGLLEIAQRNKDDVKKQQECRNRIRTSLSYLMDIVDNVLDMNQAESNEIVLENTPFDLEKLIQEVSTIVEMQAHENGIRFILEDSFITHPYLVGSPTLLNRVLMNVASNAIKYNHRGGSVYLSCKEIVSTTNKATFQFICKDTGVGMSKEFQTKAFEAYVQEGKDAITSYKGTGLGLSIVKKIVDKMDGTIELSSKEDEGTTIEITLPFEIHLVLDTDKKDVQKSIDLKGKKALLVEDNRLNQEIAKMILEDIGFEVTIASDGKEAVDLLFETKPYAFDCVFMDIMMPVMDGWTATQTIRNSNRFDLKQLPIFAMSANAFKEDVQKSKDVGMNAHITKPLNVENLVKILSEVFHS